LEPPGRREYISIWDWKGYDYLSVIATQKLERAVTTFTENGNAARQLPD